MRREPKRAKATAEEAPRRRHEELEERVRVYKDVPIGLCAFDTSLRYTHINDWLAALNGMTAKEHLGRTIGEVLSHVAEGVEPQLRHVIETGEPIVGGTVEAETPAEPGVTRTFQHNYFPIRSGDDTVLGVSCMVADITEHKRAEEALRQARDELELRVEERTAELHEANEALRQSEERVRTVMENIFDSVVTIDRAGLVETFNPAAERAFGYAASEVVGRNVAMLMAEPDRSSHDGYIGSFLDTGKGKILGVGPREVTGRRKDGSTFPLELAVTEMVSGEKQMFIGAMRDIGERKRAEEALRVSEEAKQALLGASTDSIFLLARDGTVLEANEAGARRLGTTVEEVLGKSIFEFMPPEVAESRQAMLTRLDAGEALFFQDERDGMWFDNRVNPVSIVNGKVRRFAVFARDITESKKIDDALARSEERLVQATQLAGLGYWIWDSIEDVCTYCSEECARIHGVSVETYVDRASTYDGGFSFVHPEDREKIRDLFRALRKGKSFEAEYRLVMPDGEARYVREIARPLLDDGGTVVQEYGTLYDITEMKRTEEQLRHAQKMEAVGQLTGGVAHDFNNLLAVIIGNLELLDETLEGDAKRLDFSGRAIAAARRGADLTASLLAYSRKQALQPRGSDLNQLIARAEDLYRRTLGETIEVETVLADGLWPTLVDSSQFENALLNLAVNARDAMPDGGRLTIETANRRLDSADAAADGLEAGEYVELAVSDTGAGMAADVVERAFEPFFTTKELGRGSGLGLSMVYGFVKQSGGHVEIVSELGRGTTITIRLPRAAKLDAVAAAEPSRVALAHGDGEAILVVEDDNDVRRLAVGLLSGLGYRPLEARDAPSALALIERTPDLAVLFSDVVLPGGMLGPELAREARRHRPGLKVLLTSGYTEQATINEGGLYEGVELIEKPYRRAELARKLRAVLGQ